MDLLIPVHDLATVVDPKDGVLELVAVVGRLVDADVDAQLRATGLFPQAQDKLALVDGLGEADAFGGGGGDVVACFGEEEDLARGGGTS